MSENVYFFYGKIMKFNLKKQQKKYSELWNVMVVDFTVGIFFSAKEISNPVKGDEIRKDEYYIKILEPRIS